MSSLYSLATHGKQAELVYQAGGVDVVQIQSGRKRTYTLLRSKYRPEVRPGYRPSIWQAKGASSIKSKHAKPRWANSYLPNSRLWVSKFVGITVNICSIILYISNSSGCNLKLSLSC